MNKQSIVELLKSNDRAVARALVVLNERQTADEQSSEHTRYHNGRGFRPCHARMGTSMAKFYLRNQYLTPKQIAYWRATMRDGKMRIEIYANQLLEAAQHKAAQKAAVCQPKPVANPPVPTVADRDYGNDMERLMFLQEIHSDLMDKQDVERAAAVLAEIKEIESYWSKAMA